jgi:hypothetical protein
VPLREKFPHFHSEYLGEKFNLFVGHYGTARFDVGNDSAGHVATQQLHFGGENVL